MREAPDKKLSKSSIKAWRLSISIVCFFLILLPVLLLIYNHYAFESEKISLQIIVFIAVLILVLSFLAIFFIPEIRWRHWYYEVDEHEIDLQSGIVIITRTLVPIKRVQHVDTRQGPILRKFGLADVTISTAATTHRIPALGEEVADRVRDQISTFARLAKEDV